MFRQMWTRNLSKGSRGEDVRTAQQLLKQAGFDPGPIDGIFGTRTDSAVRQFQQARKLVVDGVVGPMTWAALTTAQTPSGTTAKGRSVHMGLNVVDNGAYGMNVPPLGGCHNDANAMAGIARAQGFASTSVMLDGQATSANIINAITNAAASLDSGDMFLLTYAGHGSQLHDLGGDEGDSLDETWVAFDRQILDDELYALWGQFKPGVRIVVVSDSCHSGTMTRDVQFAYRAFASAFHDSADIGFVLDTPMDLGGQATRDFAGMAKLRQALAVVMPKVVEQLYGQSRTVMTSIDEHVEFVISQLQGDARGTVLDQEATTRNLPTDVAAYDNMQRRQLYRQVKASTRAVAPTQAKVLLISGCQDNQLSLDGSRNGLFTQRLLETWNNGSFSGNGYTDLHRQIVGLMPPQQTPNLYWATPQDLALEQARPFTI